MLEELELQSFGLVALAGLLGGVIGLERELADKPAGLRTHVFVAAGSTLLVLLSKTALMSFQEPGLQHRVQGDPIRIIQAIIVGMGVLGAGTIVHHRRDEVQGLTTAASIFLTAGVGIAIGLSRVWLAVETTLFAVLVLLSAEWIEHRLLERMTSNEDQSAGDGSGALLDGDDESPHRQGES